MASEKKNLKELFDRVRQGDRAAFDALFTRSYPVLCAFAAKFVGDGADAENMVQDVMLHLWENRKSSEIKDVNSYLFISVRNRCLTELSHRTVREKVHDSIRIRSTMSMADIQDIDIMDELSQRLEEALAGLPEEYRLTFEKNRFQNKTYKEIADEMFVSQKTVAWRMSKVLGILRVRLKDFL